MKTWRKGNLHTHSTNSDGDMPPEHVAGWYEEHGYDWLCISDHNHLTILKDVEAGSQKWPLLVPGEEVTVNNSGSAGNVPVHINGYGVERFVEPFASASITETMQENVKRIVQAGGMASINHPNYKWALTVDHLLEVDGYRFIEVFNGHPATNSFGGGGSPGTEAIWDTLLSAGKTVWGLAVDDAHHYTGEFERGRSNPGRGWVQVRTERLDTQSVLQAIDEGDFYSSNGVTIGDLAVSAKGVHMDIERENDATSPAQYTTLFHGRDGVVLESVDGLSAGYVPKPSDTYVRATVHSSTGAMAWTQPVFMDGRG